MEAMFRTLRADEIDCRVAQVKETGVTLLLYKDARCDQCILDETVGPMNWQRRHSRDNANCTVGIWDAEKQMWVEKEDTGKESKTESEKGLASDSFKRACFNWGIGRELYTAPFIFVPAAKCNIKGGRCFDNFTVESISYQEDGQRAIKQLIIRNQKTGQICYNWRDGENRAAPDREPAVSKPQRTAAPVEEPMPVKPSRDEQRLGIINRFCGEHLISHKDFGRIRDVAAEGGIIPDRKSLELSDEEFAALMAFAEQNYG